MRRKKDDKRVLIPRSSPQHVSNRNKNRSKRNRNTRNSRNNRINRNNRYKGKAVHDTIKDNRYNQQQKKPRSRLTLFLMILAIVGFVIGAGIGVSLTFDDGGDDEGPHIENVTKEMTTNLTDNDNSVIYDKDVDSVDYNSNQDVVEYNLTVEPSY